MQKKHPKKTSLKSKLESIRHKTLGGRENRWSAMAHGSDHPEERAIIQGIFIAMYNLGLSYDCDECSACWNMEKGKCDYGCNE